MICVKMKLCIVYLVFIYERAYGNSHEDLTDDADVSSTHYPRPYPAHEDLTWTFTRRSGKWLVRFNEVDIRNGRNDRCEKDYLVVTDVGNIDHTITLCGKTEPADFVSQSSSISIRFQSGSRSGISRRGFHVTVVHGRDLAHLMQKMAKHSDTIVTDSSDKQPESTWMNTELVIIGLSVCLAVCLTIALFFSYLVFNNVNLRRKHNQQTQPPPQTVLTIEDCLEDHKPDESPVCQPNSRTFSRLVVRLDDHKSKPKVKKSSHVVAIGNDYVAMKLKESGEAECSSAMGILHSEDDSASTTQPMFMGIM